MRRRNESYLDQTKNKSPPKSISKPPKQMIMHAQENNTSNNKNTYINDNSGTYSMTMQIR